MFCILRLSVEQKAAIPFLLLPKDLERLHVHLARDRWLPTRSPWA